MIVTNLYNDLQPLIRYELNDLVTLGASCSCGSGFRVIAKVIGRDDDILYFLRAEGTFGHVFPDVMSRWIITASEQIDEYVVEQPSVEHLVVHIEPREDADTDDVTRRVDLALVRGLSEHGLRVPTIEFCVGKVARGNGKFKRFRRGFSLAGLD